MMISRRWADACLVGALLVFGSGCMAYRSAIPPQAERFEERSGGVLTAELIVNAEHWANGEPSPELHKGTLERHEKAATKALLASGLFKEVGPDVQDPDVTLVFSTREEEHYSRALAYFSGMTLLIFPAWMHVTDETTCKVTEPDGELISEFSAEGRLNVVMQLLLLPAIPSVGIASSRATEGVYRSVAVDLQNHPRIKELVAAKENPIQ